MKFLRISFCALLTVILVNSGTAQENQQKAQSLGGEQLRAEIKKTIGDLSKELATEPERSNLASTVNLLMAKRIADNPRGYEKSLEFLLKFDKTESTFLSTLEQIAEKQGVESETPKITQKDIEDFAMRSASAYEKNQEEFRSFYERVVKTDSQLKGMSIEDSRKRMLQFSAWLFVHNRAEWDTAFRMTYFWPWCFPPDREK